MTLGYNYDSSSRWGRRYRVEIKSTDSCSWVDIFHNVDKVEESETSLRLNYFDGEKITFMLHSVASYIVTEQ